MKTDLREVRSDIKSMQEKQTNAAHNSGSFEARLDAVEDMQKTQRNWIGGVTAAIATMFLGWLVRK